MPSKARTNSIEDNSHPNLLEVLDELGEIFVGTADLEVSLSATLKFVLQVVDRPAGVLLVQAAGDPEPKLAIKQAIPDEWLTLLEDPKSKLREAISGTLETGAPTGAVEELGLATIIPLRTNSHNNGAMAIVGGAYSQNETDLLLRMGRFIGREIQTRLFQVDTLEHYKELIEIHTLAATQTSGPDANLTQQKMLNGICNVLNCEGVVLLLLSDSRGELLVKKSLGRDLRWVENNYLKISRSMAQECMLKGKVVVANDLSKQANFNPVIDTIIGIETRSLICAPLVVNENVLGTIHVLNKQNGKFDQVDEELLQSFTLSIGNAISNTRLIQQLKIVNADLESNRWQIKRSRNTLRTLFDSIPASIYIVDRHYELIAINKSRALQVNAHPVDLVGRKCYEALWGRYDVCAECQVGDTFKTGESTYRTMRNWAQDTEPTEQEISTFPIRDEANEQVIQVIILEEDVTEKRRMEVSLIQSEKLAIVGQLAASLAHEINNPLTAIIANAQLLQRDLDEEENLQEAVMLIERAGIRAQQVLRNLLNLSRKEHYEFDPTDVNASIREAIELLQHDLLVKSVELEVDLEEELPLVMASHNHLQGVWMNMILNARDALGDTKGTINITSKLKEDRIQVTISDTGKGIPENQLSRIFDPFFTTKETGNGTGLGLSICHRVIKQHNGLIYADSNLGEGTKFTVLLPIN